MDFTLYNMASQALNWLIPKRCLHCSSNLRKQNTHVCETCYPQLPFQDHYCIRCGQNFAADTDYCGHCISSPPSFDKCFCPFKYESSIKELICDFKYREQPELARAVASLLADELMDHGFERPDALIAVPMHIDRLRERGYNQSTLISKHLSRLLGVPMINGALYKSRPTTPQAKLNLKRRQKNLNDSFKLAKIIHVKSVAIIDDVVTTGATAEEIAKILKKNGVDYVQVWGVAHTL